MWNCQKIQKILWKNHCRSMKFQYELHEHIIGLDMVNFMWTSCSSQCTGSLTSNMTPLRINILPPLLTFFLFRARSALEVQSRSLSSSNGHHQVIQDPNLSSQKFFNTNFLNATGTTAVSSTYSNIWYLTSWDALRAALSQEMRSAGRDSHG